MAWITNTNYPLLSPESNISTCIEKDCIYSLIKKHVPEKHIFAGFVFKNACDSYVDSCIQNRSSLKT